MLFQPFHSFLTHNVGSDTPMSQTQWSDPVTARDQTRVRFYADQQPYFIPENPMSFPMSLMTVPPLQLSDPFIEFWRATPDDPLPSRATPSAGGADNDNNDDDDDDDEPPKK